MDNKEYQTAERNLKRHLMKLHNILWKQCDLHMQNKIASQKEFEQQDAKADVLMLMELIDRLCEGGGETKYGRWQKVMAQKRLITFKQHENMDLPDSYKEFCTIVKKVRKQDVISLMSQWYRES